jgi:hypothetical protein
MLLAVLVAILVVGCAAVGETPPPAAFTPPPAASVTPGPSASETPGSPVAGIVTSVDSSGLTQVKGFTLRSVAGEDLTFVMGTLENGDEFPPGHLAEHMASADPILVFFRPTDGKLVVYRLEDAP